MTVTYHPNLVQGLDEWYAARCGLLTASEMRLIITPKTLKAASNDAEKTHLYELLAQRITRYVEPHYVSDDMLRGHTGEILARALYAERYAPVTEVGFITNDKFGFTIGYSPDGLVGDDGLIECKSRRQKYQIETIVEHVAGQTVPIEFMLQVQTGLMVSEREWCDFGSYCGGLPAVFIRAYPDPVVQDAITQAAWGFETRLAAKLAAYHAAMASSARLVPTERVVEKEMYI